MHESYIFFIVKRCVPYIPDFSKTFIIKIYQETRGTRQSQKPEPISMRVKKTATIHWLCYIPVTHAQMYVQYYYVTVQYSHVKMQYYDTRVKFVMSAYYDTILQYCDVTIKNYNVTVQYSEVIMHQYDVIVQRCEDRMLQYDITMQY
ncbi:hypothetical protein STEG23_026375 [Scotinomys teguina]